VGVNGSAHRTDPHADGVTNQRFNGIAQPKRLHSEEKDPQMKPSRVTLELDPQKAAQRKEAARYRLNVIQFPILREIGFGLIACFVLVHNFYVYQRVSWDPFFLFILIAFTYSLLSWGILYLYFGKTGRFDLANYSKIEIFDAF